MRFLVCLALLLPASGFSQNLLVNPGFEEENICSEYKVKCAPEGWIYTVPSLVYYYKDAEKAHEGSYFVMLIAGQEKRPNYRTFVRSKLLCGLQKSKTYRIDFFVQSPHAVLDSIGVYFTPYDFLFEKQAYQKIVPSLYLANAVTKPIKDERGWQKITLLYKATGDEAYFTLGNFSKNGVGGPTGIPMESNFFVYFDDVSITPADANERLCANWQKAKEEIYLQDERHDFLEKLIVKNKDKPTVKVIPPSTITVRVDTLVIPDVFFATNSFVLNAKAAELLDSFVLKIQKLSLDSAFVYGHTDSRGTESYNKELSWRRANVVASYLEKKIITRFKSIGLGSDKPVADNRTPEGRRRNRRVEIFLYKKE